jgi:hypothetical protein
MDLSDLNPGTMAGKATRRNGFDRAASAAPESC